MEVRVMFILTIIIVLAVATILAKYLWSLLIPEIFPGLWEIGYIEIFFFVAVILVIIIYALFIKK
jgi:hypothetical protein